MAPHWFELVAWVALALGFASAFVIAADIALLGNRQHIAIMNLVFPSHRSLHGPGRGLGVLHPRTAHVARSQAYAHGPG
jgi:hypothetical protein